MKNKIIALALVGVMLSVCFVGVFSYADDADAIVGDGSSSTNAYVINTTENPVVLSKLKDKAVVYFNLSYDKQYAKTVTAEASVTDLSDETSTVITATDPVTDTSGYRFSSNLTATIPEADTDLKVTYTVTVEYKENIHVAPDVVYYVAYVKVLKSNNGPLALEAEFKGNLEYTINNSPVIVPAIGPSDSYYSNNLPAGLYLQTDVNGGAKVVGMIRSNVENGSFDIYQITDRDVVKTKVNYTVDSADVGKGFNYSVSAGEKILDSVNEDKTIIVKSGTPLTITTTVELTQFKAVNQTGDSAYKEISPKSNTYVLSDIVSGTVKVFMTYNNGINDNCTKVLTIIYIGSTADASLSNPVVRSY